MEPLKWEVRLWEANPSRRIAIFCCAGVAGLGGLVLFQSVMFLLIGVLCILGTTTEYWLPLRYKLDETGASVKCGFSETAIEWSKVKRAIVDKNGVKLSPLDSNTATAPFRGVYIRFKENADHVLDAISRLGGSSVSVLDSGTD